MRNLKVCTRLLKGAAVALAIVAAVIGWDAGSLALGQSRVKGGGGGSGNAPPVITSITAVQITGERFRVYGTIADENPGGCGIVFSGITSGVGTCDANGNFDVILNVPTLGVLHATPGDGVQSGTTVADTLTNAAPTTGIIATQAGGNWTFSGTVGDEAPLGLTVVLAGPPGVNGLTATVAANGTWSVTVTLAHGTSGFVMAAVEDWYGEVGTGTTYFSNP
jgi:hypothetical protein